ncbi:MAG: DUF2062 domain-containing protein [Desulfobaccales bacterium]
MSFKRSLRYHWLKFLRLQDEPWKLSWGMALGVFIGITPTVPFHMVSVLFLAPILGISPVAAFLGLQICNPLTFPFLYLASYKVGNLLLHGGAPLVWPEGHSFSQMLHLLWQGGLALQVGGLLIAIPPTIASYFLSIWLIKRYRRFKESKPASVLKFSQNPPPASRPKA